MRPELHRCAQQHYARRAALIFVALLGSFTGRPGIAESQVHTVVIVGMKFLPDVLTVKPGDTVEWHNQDIVPHNATAEDRVFQSPTIPPGGKWKYKVRKKGDYSYLCTLHPVMKAGLIAQ